MFNRLLIANRGEIACRIMRSCRRLGIETVAVYSTADAASRHVAQADYAVAIGESSASDSYLRADRIIAAALSSGAQAIHPGYGFLSEKLELIDACQANGITFVGPNRRAIETMGSKIESKRMARAAGVLCVPGYDEDDQMPQRLLDEAQRIGFPLLIKASAGGGGKGMRRVDAAADFLAMLALVRREALASFGDERVLLEKYIVNPRHLEVQLMGDRVGGLVHLFERECSIQRRFQKVVEEAPANHLPAAVADSLYEAALRMGRAMNYDNAGTVEFVLDADQGDRPYFLEVNTRLQVEHAVTEMTTGVDLVEWQLRSACGEPLPLCQEAITRQGWAIECRLNAEEPEHDYRASLGPLLGYAEPARLAGVRVDSGLHAQSEVTPYYDSMLAKVIGFGHSRTQAAERARAGLEQLRIEGVRTNAALLLQILLHPAFDDVLTTRFLEQHFPNGPHASALVRQQHVLAVSAAWAASQPVTTPVWGALRGLRLTAPAGHPARIDLSVRDVSAASDNEAVCLVSADGGYALAGVPDLRAAVQSLPDGFVVSVTQAGCDMVSVHVRHSSERRWFSWAQGRSMVWDVEHELEHSLHTGSDESQGSQLSATLPGRISEVMLQVGQRVVAGDLVLTLEAMKLYHSLTAPLTGLVQKIHVSVGDIVSHGQLLVEFEIEAEAVVTAAT